MSNPIIEARLAALESQMGWRRPSPFAWREMKDAPKCGDFLATVQEANGLAVRVIFYQPHGNREWRSITGQRIAPGCVLAWMPLPGVYRVPPRPERDFDAENAHEMAGFPDNR